jgi:hypothetical protein
MEAKRKGRPINGTHVCKCCQIEFQTAKEKCTHESNMRNRKAKTETTSSIGGGEKLGKRMKDFQTPEKQIKDTTSSAFKQPLPANLAKPQPRNMQSLFATPLGPTNPNILNALISYFNKSLQTPRVNLTSLQVEGNK